MKGVGGQTDRLETSVWGDSHTQRETKDQRRDRKIKREPVGDSDEMNRKS